MLLLFLKQNKDENDKCLEIDDKHIVRVTDEQAQKIIYKFSKCKTITEFQSLKPFSKEKYIKKFQENGISIRQIARLCGETKGMVEKYLC